jgi:hypothetical protein
MLRGEVLGAVPNPAPNIQNPEDGLARHTFQRLSDERLAELPVASHQCTIRFAFCGLEPAILRVQVHQGFLAEDLGLKNELACPAYHSADPSTKTMHRDLTTGEAEAIVIQTMAA